MNKRNRQRFAPNYDGECDNCGSSPIVPISGLCGPCHFGTAEAVNGGWWDAGINDWDEDFVKEHIATNEAE